MKNEENQFLISRPPFLADKREIEKKNEKREILVFVQPILGSFIQAEFVGLNQKI